MEQDDAIIEKDISHMSAKQQHYYQLRKHVIMTKATKMQVAQTLMYFQTTSLYIQRTFNFCLLN